MEIAESVCQPAIMVSIQQIGFIVLFYMRLHIAVNMFRPSTFTLLILDKIMRRAGVYTMGILSQDLRPTMEDSITLLESKWERFVERESFKR